MSSAPHRAAGPGALLLGALFVVAFAAWIDSHAGAGTFGYNVFTDRDLARALRWREELPVAGAEMTGTWAARVPGWFDAACFWLGSWMGDDAEGPYRLARIAFATSSLVVYLGLSSRTGVLPAAFGAAAWNSTPALLGVLGDLWNPSFVALPLALSLVGVLQLVVDRRAAGLTVWAASTALAAQLHLAVLMWALTMLTGLIVFRAREVWRGAPRALGVVALLYAPYVLVDLVRGGEQLRALGSQFGGVAGGGYQLVDSVAFDPLEKGLLLGSLGPDGPWSGLGASALVVVGAATVLRLRDAPRADLAGVLAIQLAAGLGVLLAQAAFPPNARYFAGGALAAVGLAVLGVHALAELLPVPRTLRSLALAAGAAAVLPPRGAVGTKVWPVSHDPLSWATLRASLDTLARSSGLDPVEVARRSAWLELPADGSQPEWNNVPTVDHLAAMRGLVWEGSGSPPCWLVLRARSGSLPDTLDAAALAELLELDVPVARVEGPIPLAGPWSAWSYVPEGPWYPTTASQRYVDTPVERLLRSRLLRAPVGTVEALPTDAGHRWGAVFAQCPENEPGCGKTWAAFDLVPDGTRLVARLHSNQLRGKTDNEGWYQARALRHPRLELRRAIDGAVATVTFAEGRLGARWSSTPLQIAVPHPGAGIWQVRLVTSMAPVNAGDPVGIDPRRVETIVLDLGTLELGSP